MPTTTTTTTITYTGDDIVKMLAEKHGVTTEDVDLRVSQGYQSSSGDYAPPKVSVDVELGESKHE